VRHAPRLPLEALEPYLLPLPPPASATAPPPQLDWTALFGNANPVEIEVGFGKGLFLLNAALAYPEVNFAGVEIERKYQLFTANRVAKREMGNVRLAHADARSFLRERVPVASVQAVHVYFPDPWWKKRHQKRRVFTEDFARQCARVLTPAGRLHVATDVEEYFQIITELVAQVAELRPAPPPQPHEPSHSMDYLTNYERKARLKDKPVHRATYEQTMPAPGGESCPQ
jgi:tRNA (guanine-N7-)-methyltransferase